MQTGTIDADGGAVIGRDFVLLVGPEELGMCPWLILVNNDAAFRFSTEQDVLNQRAHENHQDRDQQEFAP